MLEHRLYPSRKASMVDHQRQELLRHQPSTKLLQHSLGGLLAAWECTSKAHTKPLRRLRTCMVAPLHKVASRLPLLHILKITERPGIPTCAFETAGFGALLFPRF